MLVGHVVFAESDDFALEHNNKANLLFKGNYNNIIKSSQSSFEDEIS